MRLEWISLLLTLVVTTQVAAQTSQAAASAPQATTLVAQSLAAMTHGTTVSDVTLSGNANWIVGGDHLSGPVTLKARGSGQSRIDLNLTGLQRTEIRTVNNGIPAVGWIDGSGTHKGAEHNCYTEAASFFPALWSLWNPSDATLTATLLGSTTYNSVNAQHLQFLRQYAGDQLSSALSTTHVYVDPTSFLPLAITFKAHPDTDALRDVPVEIRFANYQNVTGVMVPFRIQKLLNGSLMLDITIQSATINSGLSDPIFAIQ